jgi:hypothetical protein
MGPLNKTDMKNLNSSDLVTISGGADGDFAELHGYCTAVLIRSFESSIFGIAWYKKLKENGWI